MDAITLSQVLEALQRIGAPNPATASQADLFGYFKRLEGLVDALESSLGGNADAAGTGTVFARLAQIAGYVDAVEGLTDGVEGLIGTASPTSGGTDTLFKYLKQLETLIGANTNGAGTGTLFARLAQIAGYVDAVEGYVDTVESSLGQTGDAANASGSAHAKLKDLKSYLTGTVYPMLGGDSRAPWASGKSISVASSNQQNVSVPGGSTVDVLNITGPRIILGGYVYVLPYSSSSSAWYKITKITADSATIFSARQDDTYTDYDTNGYYSIPPAIDTDTYAYYSTNMYYDTIPKITIPMLPVQSSFKVSLQNVNSAAYTFNIRYHILHCAV